MKEKKLPPKVDPALFEYEPQEVDDAEVFEILAATNVKPEDIRDPAERAAYIEYLKASAVAPSSGE